MLREHFKCDQASGNLVGIVGSVVLAPAGSPTYGVAGQFGNAVLANSSNQFVGSSPVLNLGDGTTDWTFVAWLKRNAAGNGQWLNKLGSNQDLAISWSNTFGIQVSYDSVPTGIGSAAIGDWFSVSVKYVAADLKCYCRLNNGAAVTVSRVGNPVGNDGLTLGTSGVLRGFDEIGLYDHALSDAELTALMKTVPDVVKGAKFRAGQSYVDGFRAGQRIGVG